MKNLSSYLIVAGLALIVSSLAILVLTFFPVLSLEIGYLLRKTDQNAQVALHQQKNIPKNAIVPADENFGIVIPKIGANAKVISNVNPYNEREYQVALTKGVAHARGTVFPGERGNVFIFSHSSQNFYEATHYNSIFYLLSKMEKGDSIYLFYKRQKYEYKVTDKIIVDPASVSYLTNKTLRKTLTLMTCWPPGTTLKRLLILGSLYSTGALP